MADTHKIIGRGREFVSPPLSRLLVALHERGDLDFAEALWIGFAIAPYDEHIHAMKIHNLIARANQVLPRGGRLQTKGQHIYWTGRRDRVYCRRSHPLRQALGDRLFHVVGTRWRGFSKPIHPRMLVEMAGGRRILKREELQDLMHTSKSSTTRWLIKWQSKGLIRRQGIGRSSSYLIDIIGEFRPTNSV